MIRQFTRFVSVGVVATLIHVTVALLLNLVTELPAQAANFGGFLSAVLFSYAGHMHFSFSVTPRHAVHGPRFAVTALAAYLASSSIVFGLHETMGYPFVTAMAVVGAAVPMVTFWIMRLWTFTENEEAARDEAVGWVVALAFAACHLAILWDTPINHDSAWYLLATEDWLHGATLYGDIIEVNPPLNFYYTAPAVVLAQNFGLSLANASFLLGTILLTGILGWCWRLLPNLALERRVMLLLLIAAALTLPFLASAQQREHLMVLFMAPWVIGRLTGTPGDAGEMPRAAVAALGICLKPFFVLYPVALTAHEVIVTRSLRPIFAPGNLVFLGIGLSYVLATVVLHPTYFTEIVPIAGLVYGEYGFSPAHILGRFLEPGLMIALGLAGAFTLRTRARSLTSLLLLTGAAMAIYLIQWTGYSYQFNPILSFTMLALGWLLLCADIQLGRPAVVAALGTLAVLAYPMIAAGTYTKDRTDTFVSELEALGKGTRLLTFSTALTAGPAVALRTGMDWASGYPALWLMPGAVDGLDRTDCTREAARCARLQALAERTRQDFLQKMETRNPDVLIFDFDYAYIARVGFSWYDFLNEDPQFRAMMEEFRYVRDGDTFHIFLHESLVED